MFRMCGNKRPARCNRWGFIAKLIVCWTCFGYHYAHHQELKIIIQVVATCGTWCFGLQVVGLAWSCGLCVRFAGCCTSILFLILYLVLNIFYKIFLPQNILFNMFVSFCSISNGVLYNLVGVLRVCIKTVTLCNLHWEFYILPLEFNSDIRWLNIDSLPEYADSGGLFGVGWNLHSW